MSAPTPDNGAPAGGPPPAPLARRWVLNLALLAAVVALGLFLWYRSGSEPEAQAPPLTQLTPDAIDVVEIERAEEPTVRMERTGGVWRLTAPIEARVDAFAVDSVLRLAQAPADKPVATDGGNLARYGLAPPVLTVRLDDVALRFGAAHPIEDERYLRYRSSVYLIPARFYGDANVPHTHFLDTRLIEPGRKPVAFKLPDFTLTLEDGTWRRRPEIEALSSDRINAFVDDWRHARALQVEEHADRKIKERVVVTLEDPDGTRSDLIIGVTARRPELVLYRPDEGLQYHLPEAMDQRLLDIREK